MSRRAAEVVLYYSKRSACAGSARVLELMRADRARECSLVCVEDLLDVLRERGETLPEWLDGTPICVEIVSDRERVAYRGTDAVRLLHSDAPVSHAPGSPSGEVAGRFAASVEPLRGDYDEAHDAREATLASSRQAATYDAARRSDPPAPGDEGGEGEGEGEDPRHDAEVDFRSRAVRGKIAPGMHAPRSSATAASPYPAVEEGAERSGGLQIDERWAMQAVDDGSDAETDAADGKVTNDMITSALRDRNMGDSAAP